MAETTESNRGFTPDVCERIVHAALKAGDMEGVHSALMVMAPQDPHRAQRLVDTLRLGIALARTGVCA